MGHLAADADHYRMTVNRANVAIWSVGLAVELGDGAHAVRRAAAMRGFVGVTPNRVSHHYIDLVARHLARLAVHAPTSVGLGVRIHALR